MEINDLFDFNHEENQPVFRQYRRTAVAGKNAANRTRSGEWGKNAENCQAKEKWGMTDFPKRE
ncbi:hypothetical protein [Methylocaldum marinum]|nr:hypothetical protein [Methylocaldum marinum]